ncbi:hypothetical protein E2C01_070045 [Portunus trituberculatus]|uniref:CCHC-type domain-containing protein n=1 Tax=Portunus trituberculatus TaxID=210409 RepID=A0A5B7HW98_PORTR|nr:hypothetical protein [Portunus trituberculatus]
MAASAVAATQGAQTAPAELPSTSYAAATAAGEPKITCYYCQREGHTANKCFKRKKDKREAAATTAKASAR